MNELTTSQSLGGLSQDLANQSIASSSHGLVQEKDPSTKPTEPIPQFLLRGPEDSYSLQAVTSKLVGLLAFISPGRLV